MSGGLDAETALLFWVDEALRLCGLLCLGVIWAVEYEWS